MGDDERKRRWLRRAHVDEVDAQPQGLLAELRKGVEAGLPRAPVVLLAPVGAHLLEVGERDALGPVRHGLRLGPARRAQPPAQVVELLVAGVDPEGLGLAHRGSSRSGFARAT